jgi:hypothetical protein
MHRSLALLLLVSLSALSLVACGSGDSDDSSGDDDGGSNRSNPLGRPATASSKDDKGSSEADKGKFGSVTYKITGNVEASGELPFQPAASVFSGGAWQLTFASESGEAIMAVNLAQETMSILFGDGKITVVGAASGSAKACDIKVDKQDAGGAKGSFDCKNAAGTNKNGALFGDGVKVSGNFEARSK